MPLLDRLLLGEIAIPLGVGLLAILQLLFILQLLQLNEVVFTSAVTASDLMRLTAALAPHFLVSAVPLAFMLGVQLGLGRLAADQEVLALSASGTHPLRLYRVPLAIGLGLAVIVAGLTQWAEPWGLQQLNRVLNDVIKRNLQSGLEPGIFNDALPRFMIYVASEEPAENGAYATWHGVLIEDDVGDGAPLLALAELGRIEDVGGPALALRLFRGELHRMEAKGETVARFQEGRFVIGVQDSVANKNKFARNEPALSRTPHLRRICDPRHPAGSGDAGRSRIGVRGHVGRLRRLLRADAVRRGARGKRAHPLGGRVHPGRGRVRSRRGVYVPARPQRDREAAVRRVWLALLLACSPRDKVEVPILNYHSVGEAASNYVVPVAAFEQQLDWLAGEGFRTISLHELAESRA